MNDNTQHPAAGIVCGNCGVSSHEHSMVAHICPGYFAPPVAVESEFVENEGSRLNEMSVSTGSVAPCARCREDGLLVEFEGEAVVRPRRVTKCKAKPDHCKTERCGSSADAIFEWNERFGSPAPPDAPDAEQARELALEAYLKCDHDPTSPTYSGWPMSVCDVCRGRHSEESFFAGYDAATATLRQQLAAAQEEKGKLAKSVEGLQYLLARIVPQCLHCGLENYGTCPAGFPGCAKADDLLAETPERKEYADRLIEKMHAALTREDENNR